MSNKFKGYVENLNDVENGVEVKLYIPRSIWVKGEKDGKQQTDKLHLGEITLSQTND